MSEYKYKLDFYRDKNGYSEILDFLSLLLDSYDNNKDARIQHDQIMAQFKLLCENGTNLPSNITKHIDEDIWELRPGRNRIFYFCWHDDTFIMLHYFREKTNKTPKREIMRAKSERNDYLRRHP